MKRVLLALLLCAAFARCDTEVYFDLENLTWAGSGTEYWARWYTPATDFMIATNSGVITINGYLGSATEIDVTDSPLIVGGTFISVADPR